MLAYLAASSLNLAVTILRSLMKSLRAPINENEETGSPVIYLIAILVIIKIPFLKPRSCGGLFFWTKLTAIAL
jgi:hypothetical protein